MGASFRGSQNSCWAESISSNSSVFSTRSCGCNADLHESSVGSKPSSESYSIHHHTCDSATVTTLLGKFRNAILCEDIRDEVGGKLSLMGVLSGEIMVPSFPATLQIAVFMQYVSDETDPAHLVFQIRLMQDEIEMAKATLEADVELLQTATLVLPKGFAAFEKPMTFRLMISANGAPEVEVIAKRVIKQ